MSDEDTTINPQEDQFFEEPDTLDEEDEGVGPSCRMFIRDGLEID